MSTTSTPTFESLPGFSPPSKLGSYRAADYWNLPEDEPAELLYGRIVMSPASNPLHQTISAVLTELLLKVSRASGGRMLAAPSDVEFADHSIVQPDLIYVTKTHRQIIQDHVVGPPDLAIEILSTSNTRRDRNEKMKLYAEFGVGEYWIVEPNERQFEFYINRGKRFEVQPQADDRYASSLLPELTIDLAEFWQDVAQQVD